MPRPWLRWLILAFWVATSSWLAWGVALRPLLHRDEPPPYAISLVDEAQRGYEIHWTVLHTAATGGGTHTEIYRGVSSVRHHPADDTFELRVRITRPVAEAPQSAATLVVLKRVDSLQRVSRQGELRQVEVELEFLAVVQERVLPAEAFCRGVIRDGHFSGSYKLSVAGLSLQRDIEPVPVSSTGAVLTPLHPVNRVDGIRPGQEWSEPLFDPLRVIVGELQKAGVPSGLLPADRQPVLHARVLPEPQPLNWNKHDVHCYVIVYREQDEVRARTWVETTTGAVLRQEVISAYGTMEFVRESPVDGL